VSIHASFRRSTKGRFASPGLPGCGDGRTVAARQGIGRSREEAICIAMRTKKIEGRVAEELRDADGQQDGHGSAVPLRED
jgi:hypothetical protein